MYHRYKCCLGGKTLQQASGVQALVVMEENGMPLAQRVFV